MPRVSGICVLLDTLLRLYLILEIFDMSGLHIVRRFLLQPHNVISYLILYVDLGCHDKAHTKIGLKHSIE